jgi:hypothetical protein
MPQFDRSYTAEEHYADLAALDQLDDAALWDVACSQLSAGDATRLQWLLEEQGDMALTISERAELAARAAAAERTMQRAEHAAALLQARGHVVPPLDQR